MINLYYVERQSTNNLKSAPTDVAAPIVNTRVEILFKSTGCTVSMERHRARFSPLDLEILGRHKVQKIVFFFVKAAAILSCLLCWMDFLWGIQRPHMLPASDQTLFRLSEFYSFHFSAFALNKKVCQFLSRFFVATKDLGPQVWKLDLIFLHKV